MSVSVEVRGLKEVQRAFRRIGGDLPRITRKALRDIAEPVRVLARANIEHKTGRHGDPNLPPLERSIRIGARAAALSVYSNQVYAGIQERGGRVGHGAIVHRARASAYMSKAVIESRPATIRALEQLGDTIEREFNA